MKRLLTSRLQVGQVPVMHCRAVTLCFQTRRFGKVDENIVGKQTPWSTGPPVYYYDAPLRQARRLCGVGFRPITEYTKSAREGYILCRLPTVLHTYSKTADEARSSCIRR